MNLLHKHNNYFKDIPELYTYQEKVLSNLFEERNTLAIISTGGGKSLIFQLMALELQGITIVISPLLALMKEQVDELKKRGINAIALNSSLTFDEQRVLLRNLATSDIKLLYVSPERLQNGIFRASLAASKIQVSMIVIDEAHCISQWGQSFRPEYSQIKPFHLFLKELGYTPLILGLTATISKEPRGDIVDEFEIEDSDVIIPNEIIRDNLSLTIKKVENEDQKVEEITKFLELHKPNKVLAYLYSRRECSRYAGVFSEKNYKTHIYHSDLSKTERDDSYLSFLEGKIDILFATTAFGMGINIPDIDSVIHIHIPNSIEEYYQHVGRGWRDKSNPQICNCLALWSNTNFKRRKERTHRERYTVESLKKAINNLIGNPTMPNQIVAKDKEEFLNSSDNLQLVRFKLEEKGMIETIGEINGSPMKIELSKPTTLWSGVTESLDGIDSFIWASAQTSISLSEIIDHLYEQEFKGNIKKLPASRRDLFFKIIEPDISENVLNEIITELNVLIDRRVRDLEDLEYLFCSDDPTKVINEHLS